jgi:hypothetical protein
MAFPATQLVLMPKFPLRMVAYVALFTGIGVSVSTARWIQFLMQAFCLTLLVYLTVRYWRRRSSAKSDQRHLVAGIAVFFSIPLRLRCTRC